MSDASITSDAIRRGDRRALARLLTGIENQTPEALSVLAQLYPQTGQAWVVGVTGAPGTGKSSLVNRLAQALRERDQNVAIVAIDPTSPFSGGALLGDRIRMRELSGDPGVFIRSMATRGSLGGLAPMTRDVVRALDAAGYAFIFVETVGAGQNEVDVVRTAHTTLVVEAPGLGDEVQAIKAGILEIADILVLNKADRPGITQTQRALRSMLETGHPAARGRLRLPGGWWLDRDDAQPDNPANIWWPPLLKTVATAPRQSEEAGIEALVDQIEAHRQHLLDSGQHRLLERHGLEFEIYERLQKALMKRLSDILPSATLAHVIDRIQRRETDPHQAIVELLDQINLSSDRS